LPALLLKLLPVDEGLPPLADELRLDRGSLSFGDPFPGLLLRCIKF
jgi:hypothetical protein